MHERQDIKTFLGWWFYVGCFMVIISGQLQPSWHKYWWWESIHNL